MATAEGSAAARAMVIGVLLSDPANIDDHGQAVAVAFAGEDGRYDLYLWPGVYALTVRRDWRAAPAVWWDGKDTLPTCDLLGVDAGRGAQGVDFVLP